MKKQLFSCLIVAVFIGICGLVNAEETTKEMRGKWRRNKAKRSGKTVGVAGAIIWAKYSEELAELRKLRKEDPEAFKIKSKAFHEKVRKEVKAERIRFKKLIMEYRKTQDPKIREAIIKYISNIHDLKIDAEAKKVAMLKKRLEKAEKKLTKVKAKKEETINKRLKTILKDPKLNW